MRSILVLPLVLPAACSSVSVKTDFDPAFDFGDLKTWTWLEPVATETPEQPDGDVLTSEHIRDAIESELNARGYVQAGSGATPDFHVVSHAIVQEEFGTEYVYNNYGYGYGASGYGGMGQPVTYAYEEGRLVIDILRGADRQMIWSGAANAKIDPDASATKHQQRVSQAVVKVLSKFPPKGK